MTSSFPPKKTCFGITYADISHTVFFDSQWLLFQRDLTCDITVIGCNFEEPDNTKQNLASDKLTTTLQPCCFCSSLFSLRFTSFLICSVSLLKSLKAIFEFLTQASFNSCRMEGTFRYSNIRLLAKSLLAGRDPKAIHSFLLKYACSIIMSFKEMCACLW